MRPLAAFAFCKTPSPFVRICLLLISLSFLASAVLHAQTNPPPRVTQVIDETRLATLRGHVSPLVRESEDRGPVDDSAPFGQIMLLLARTGDQQKNLDALADDLHNAKSENFHKWLTPAEFGQRFEPAGEDVAAVAAWLQSKGLKVVEIPPSKTHITFTGTMGQLRAAFHVDIHHLRVNGEAHIAAMNEPRVPAALAPVILGLHKLDDFQPQPQHINGGAVVRDPVTGRSKPVEGTVALPSIGQAAAQAKGAQSKGSGKGLASPDYTNSGNLDVGPQDFYTIYNENPLFTAGITGAGQTIAVLEEVTVNPADVTSFRAQFGLPPYPTTPNSTQGGVNYIYGSSSGVGGDGACSTPTNAASDKGEEGEADLDLQWSGTVAPNATIDFVACGPVLNTGNFGSGGVDHAAQHVVNYLSTTVTSASLSYGWCESTLTAAQNLYYANQWEQFAAEGITAIVSSGDSGTTACNNGSSYVTHNPSANGLGSSAWNVSAGGTDFGDYYESNDYANTPATTWWGPNTTDNGSALSYIPEIAWGGGCSNGLTVSIEAYENPTVQPPATGEELCNAWGPFVEGVSGGISTVTAHPTWQNVYGVGLYSGSTTFRTVPDVSLFAAAGWWYHSLVYCESDEAACAATPVTDSSAGGTSFVAPMLNGLMALINQKTGVGQGQANYNFYNLAAQEYGLPGAPNAANLANCSGSAQGVSVGGACIFQDIANTPSLQGGTILSDNVQPCRSITDCYKSNPSDIYGLTTPTNGGDTPQLAFYTGAGYDVVTGLGSVNITNLVENWSNLAGGYASGTTLAVSAQEIPTNGSVTLTATVAALGRGQSAAPAGFVQFYNGSPSGSLIGGAPITSSCTGNSENTSCIGTATLLVQATQLNFGPNNIVASFAGDAANDAPSTSPVETVAVYTNAETFSLTAPGPIVAGQYFTATVTAFDHFGDIALGFNGGVNITSSDPTWAQHGNPTQINLVNGVGQLVNVTLTKAPTSTITAVDRSTGTVTGTGTFAITPGNTGMFSVTGPASTVAGVPFGLNLLATDVYGNPTSNYNGTVTFTSSDPLFVSPAPLTFSNSILQATVTLKTSGSQGVGAADTVSPGISGGTNVNVNPAPVARLTINIPTGQFAGDHFYLVVEAYDAYGNIATNATDGLVLTSSDPTFSYASPVTLAGGSAAPLVSLTLAGLDSITATDMAHPSATVTGSTTIIPGNAASLSVAANPSAYLDAPFNLTVTSLDHYGNVAVAYNGTVNFTSTDPAAKLPGPSALTNGTGNFTATLFTTGSQTITATDNTFGYTGTTSPIQVTIPNLVVTTNSDDLGAGSNCTVQTTPGTGTDSSCSLRDALAAAGSDGSASITFDSTRFPTPQAIILSNGTLNIPSYTSISGPTSGSGATLTNLVTVNGNSASTVFTVSPGVTGASLTGLNIENGAGVTGFGGGIYNGGTLAVSGSTIAGNQVNFNGGPAVGGGIFNSGTLTLLGSTISGNSVTGSSGFAVGGGIYSNSATLTVTNSTISGNTASAGGSGVGGGLLVGGGTVTLTNSTISGNSADGQGGGVYSSSSNATLANNIISGNSAPSGSNFYGNTYTDHGGNLIGGVALAPLANNGGPTQTVLPQPGGRAICGGTLANATGLSTDQRGFPRTTTYSGPTCADSGAVQTNYTAVQFSSASYLGDPNYPITPAPVVSVTENGQNIGNVPVALGFTGTGTASGLGPVTTVAGAGAAFSGIEVSTGAKSDQLSVTLPITAAGNPVQPAPLTATAAVSIEKLASQISVVSSLNPAQAATSFTFTATVGGNGPTPTGTVNFYSGHILIGAVVLSSGVAQLPLTALPSDFSEIIAHYLGDANYLPAFSAGFYQVLTRVATAGTVAATPNPGNVGTPITITDTLSTTLSGIPPTGNVTFYVDSVSQGPIPVLNGVATFLASSLTGGRHLIAAQYGGDANYIGGNNANTIQVTVNRAPTTLAVTSSLNPAPVGQAIVFTATVSSAAAAAPPTGTVNFYSGNTFLGARAVSAGVAALTLSVLPSDYSTITAKYSGDAYYLNSAFAGLSQQIAKATTNVTIVPSANPVTQGSPLTITATVASTVAGLTPTGNVVLYLDKVNQGAVPLIDGQATFTTSTLSAGSHSFGAVYGGDINYLSATVAKVLVVNVSAPTVSAGPAISSPDAESSGAGAQEIPADAETGKKHSSSMR